MSRWISLAIIVVSWTSAFAQTPAQAPPTQQAPAAPYEPRIGQPGKDVVWVPSPESTVEKMLDMAKVTPQDFVIDLGSGDGRNVIAAAKRGARALGVEYNPDMVELSKRNAATAGVADRASFVQGDMYEADISKATVLALFLLPDNLTKLKAKFADLPPGTRIAANTFGIEGWTAEETFEITDNCQSWCSVLLYVVPAKVEGTWQAPQGALTLKQAVQTITGTLGADAIENGRMRGDHLTFSVRGVQYSARVKGSSMTGTSTSSGTPSAWSAKRS
jgi:SAM-dependent methyltransferase